MGSRQTSEQIYENLAVYASNIMKLYGILPHEISDCIQAGFIALLEQLAREPYFLACMTRRQAVYFILARCKISTMRYREQQSTALRRWLMMTDMTRRTNTQSPVGSTTVRSVGQLGRRMWICG